MRLWNFPSICLVAGCMAVLLSYSALAAIAPIGTVVNCDNALLSGLKAAGGATVYPGDSLSIQPNGELRMAMSGGQLYFQASTEATLAGAPKAVQAIVRQGAVDFSTPHAGTLEIKTPLGVVKQKGNSQNAGQVDVIGPKEITVRALRGSLVLDTDGELRTVAEGEAYRFVDESDPQDPQGYPYVAQKKRHRRRKIGAFIILGGTAVGSYAIWNALTTSPTTLSGGPQP